MILHSVPRDRALAESRLPVIVKRMSFTSTTDAISYECTKLMLVLEGESTITHEGGSFTVRSGDIAVLPHGSWFAGSPSPSAHTMTMYIDTAYLKQQAMWLDHEESLISELAHGNAPSSRRTNVLIREHLARSLTKMIDAPIASSADELMQLSRLNGIVALLEGSTRTDVTEHVRRREVEAAVRLLLSDLSKPWTVARLARETALSTSQLTRLFNAELGVAPAKFVREARAAKIADLLRMDKLSLEQASALVGFRHPSQAHRLFRSYYGMTPGEYRASVSSHERPIALKSRSRHGGQLEAVCERESL